MFKEEILKDTNRFFFEKQQAVNADENITLNEDKPMDVDTTNQMLQASNILYNVYAKSAILKGELPSAEMQAAVGNNHGKIHCAFNNFRNILKKITKSVC